MVLNRETFGNFGRHLWLSQLCREGVGGGAAGNEKVEAKGAAQNPTVHRPGSMTKLISP